MNGLNHLPDNTLKVINKLAQLEITKKFTFVGGPALTVYLSHRLSEDIDLFTWEKELDSLEIQNAIQNAGFGNMRIINLSKTQADLILDDVEVTFIAHLKPTHKITLKQIEKHFSKKIKEWNKSLR